MRSHMWEVCLSERHPLRCSLFESNLSCHVCLVQIHAVLKKQARNLCYLSTVTLQGCASLDEAAVVLRLRLC